MGIEFSYSLEPEANVVIINRKDLERTGLFEDLEYNIKKELKLYDDLEHAHHNWDEQDCFEKTYIKSKIYTEQSLQYHPYIRWWLNISNTTTKSKTSE